MCHIKINKDYNNPLLPNNFSGLNNFIILGN